MFTQNNLLILFYSIPVYQMLFYSIQLLSFRKTNAPRRYLGFLLLAMTLFLIMHAAHQMAYNSLMGYLYCLYIPTLLLLAPLFYMFVISLAKGRHFMNKTTRAMLFLPPVLLLLINLFTFWFSPQHRRLQFLADDHSLAGTPVELAGTLTWILWLGLIVLLAVQLALALIRTRKFLQNEKMLMDRDHGYLAHFDIRWVSIISLSLLVFTASGAVQIHVGTQEFISVAIFNLLLLVSGGLTGYYGMKQDGLLLQVAAVGSYQNKTQPAIEQTASNTAMATEVIEDIDITLAPEEIAEIKWKIHAIMQQEKLFLNNNFSMADLCSATGFKRYKVSYVINNVMEKNFYGLVNEYRVQEAIALLSDKGQSYTIDGIADTVGFSSRSSFYACFRKYTGLTPKEYLGRL